MGSGDRSASPLLRSVAREGQWFSCTLFMEKELQNFFFFFFSSKEEITNT